MLDGNKPEFRLSPAAVITAALNGPVATTRDNPGVPTTPEKVASSARGAYEAGAAVVHVHVRDHRGRPTADLETTRRTIGLVEEACAALVQLSTGVGLSVPFEERARLVETRPRMATLNPCTIGEFENPPDGVRRLAARMQELGVKPELEIYDVSQLEVALELADEGLIPEPLQFSIIMGHPRLQGEMPSTPSSLVELVSRMPAGTVWQTIALGALSQQLTVLSLALGGNARTGLEDTLTLRTGAPAPSNAALVEQLVATTRLLDREPATVQEVEELLRLPGPHRR